MWCPWSHSLHYCPSGQSPWWGRSSVCRKGLNAGDALHWAPVPSGSIARSIEHWWNLDCGTHLGHLSSCNFRLFSSWFDVIFIKHTLRDVNAAMPNPGGLSMASACPPRLRIDARPLFQRLLLNGGSACASKKSRCINHDGGTLPTNLRRRPCGCSLSQKWNKLRKGRMRLAGAWTLGCWVGSGPDKTQMKNK